MSGKKLWNGWELNWDGPEFISKVQGAKQSVDGGIMVFKHYSLEKFENEDGATDCIRDFERLCHEKGIQEFKIKETI